MNTTHEYTDEQIQNAIGQALASKCLSIRSIWEDIEAPPSVKASFARAFLAALSKPTTPWTLPTPPTGHHWHRNDWTQTMLPEGYRPLLKDEPWLHGDEILRYNEWQVAGQHEDDAIGSPTTKCKCHCRTRRPLPAQVNAEPTDAWANADNAKAFQEFQDELEAVWEGKPTDSPQAAQYHMPKLPNPLAPLWTPRPGDVVRLKSGGQNMTVELVNDPGIALCSWMTLAGNLETKRIATVMLTPAN